MYVFSHPVSNLNNNENILLDKKPWTDPFKYNYEYMHSKNRLTIAKQLKLKYYYYSFITSK